MTAVKPGEIVNVTITGVRVDAENADGTVTIVAEHSDGGPAHWQMPPQAAVERVAPAEWPPRPGDRWRNPVGPLFAVDDRDPDAENRAAPIVRLVNVEGAHCDPEFILTQCGPLVLVHREDEPDEPSPYAHLIGQRVAVHFTDGRRVTGILTDAKPHGITVRVDNAINRVRIRDIRTEYVARVVALPDDEQDGDRS